MPTSKIFYHRDYYIANKNKIQNYNKSYRLANKQYFLDYREKNKEHLDKYYKKYYDKNLKRCRINTIIPVYEKPTPFKKVNGPIILIFD
jgi:hypothetical protein